MPDSAPSPIVTATSPAQVPAAPVINSVIFPHHSLRADVTVILPETDADGRPYPSTMVFTGIKIFFAPTGTLSPETIPVESILAYVPGQQVVLEIDVPAWSTNYDFMAEVII